MDDAYWGSHTGHHPPRRPLAPDAPAVDWSPAYQLPYDEQPEWPHQQQHRQQQHQHPQQPSYYASLFSAYRDDPATTNPPSPTSPNTRDYRSGGFATTTSASTFSSPGGSWEQWPPDQSALRPAAGPAASTWIALQNELSMLQQVVPNNVPPPPTVPFYGMRTPPPTGRVPPAEGAFPIQAHDSSPQFWTQPWSMPGGGGERLEISQPTSLEQALPPPPSPPQRTRYSAAGVILDEEDFLDYATSSLDWLDSAAAANVAADQTTRPQPSSPLPRLDLNLPIMETKPVSPRLYMQLLSPLEPTRPASAPPEKSRRPQRPSATGHSGAIEHEDGDVFYQITNRRRSSSVDATMARAAAATSTTTTATPPSVEERPSSSFSRPAPPQHRASMRGWVHYERRTSMASLEDPNPSSTTAYLSSAPYPPPRPGTPTRPSPAAARQTRRASAAASASASSRRSSAAVTESGSPNTSPSRTGGGRHHRPSSLSFVNFSSADAPKLMKAVSKSGGVAKHKRGPPPESRKGDHPHL